MVLGGADRENVGALIKGDKILKLRDDKGVPLWAGPR